MNAFDRHKQLVNNYLTYYGKGARNLFKTDKTKWKKDIDLARENHRFLWEVRKKHPENYLKGSLDQSRILHRTILNFE